MLVDSCFDAAQQPASLAYLRSIGVEPGKVVLIVATHWHDDHIGGLSDLVRACPSADFAYSGALSSREFFALVGAFAERSQMRSSGVSEFAEIARILKSRDAPALKLAVESRRLWFRRESEPVCTVDALSPCDAAIGRAQKALADLFPKEDTSKRAVIAPSPNHASVVLLVRVGEARVLLGADLEETSDLKTGWSALLESCDLSDRASVFKIPHHGSSNADQPQVWDEALSSRPWALITPFVWGRHQLPLPEDCKRIADRTDRAYLTAAPVRKRRKRAHAVEATLRNIEARPVLIDPPMGHVRLRSPECDNEAWNADLFGPAFHLD
jgi:hypothetical protein